MKAIKYITLLLAGAMVLVGISSFAQASGWQAKKQGDILVRLRGIAFIPVEDQTVEVIGGDADASNDYVPELDFTYFFTDHIAAELILATTHHDMDLDNTTAGNVDLGDVWVLPPILTLQYHFNPIGGLNFSPYLGAGINYTIFYGEDAAAGSAAIDIDYEDSFGYALQAGVDIPVSDRLFINFDVKKVWVDTDLDVTLAGGAIIEGNVDLDPWVFGIGIGYKF